MVLVKEDVYTIKDYVMVVTGAIQHVKFQWQTILGFSQQRMNGVLKKICCGSVSTASLLCRANADETAVTVTQRTESDTNTASGTGLIPSEAVRAKSATTCRTLMTYLWLNWANSSGTLKSASSTLIKKFGVSYKRTPILFSKIPHCSHNNVLSPSAFGLKTASLKGRSPLTYCSQYASSMLW